MCTIEDVLKHLTTTELEGVAKKRAKRLGRKKPQKAVPGSLAQSYGNEWSDLLKDMNKTVLVKAMTVLDTDELRVVALRAFDGHKTSISELNWGPDGTAPQKRQAVGVVRDLCHWVGDVGPESWKKEIAPRLRDIGVESTDVPKDRKTKVLLRKIFR